MSERILHNIEGGVCTLTLNRPDKLNALDLPAFEALDAQIDAISKDDRIGCVVLRGAGKGFCAGADLIAMSDDSDRAPTYKQGVIGRLSRLRQPTVAAIHGVCFTGGLELALGCDFLVAEDGARFADTHGKWGFVGTWGISQRLPRKIGLSQAKRMMMTSRIIDAHEAERIGLIDARAPAGQLDATLNAFVGEIIANSWHTNMSVKRLLLDTEEMTLADALVHEHENYPGLAPDYLDRLAAFSKKG